LLYFLPFNEFCRPESSRPGRHLFVRYDKRHIAFMYLFPICQ
jgi:hypothetical protein